MNKPSVNSRDRRRYTETIRQAHLGVREAQYQVGLMYANGIGTAQNLALAIEWVAKAANKGLASAQYLLATRYALGVVVEKDERVALAWYLSAAQQGHSKAILALGRFFLEAHPELAKTHFEWAAQSGSSEAQYALAIVLDGKSISEKDRQQMVDLLTSAAERGHAKAQVMLGKTYAAGLGVAKDFEQAREWLRAAVRQNSPSAYVALAELDAQGGRARRKNMRAGSLERREQQLRWGASQASQDSDDIYALGVMFERGIGVGVDLEKAIGLFRLAAEHGESRAQCSLARLLAQDQPFKAIEWAERAAKEGNPEAALLAGRLHLAALEGGAGSAISSVYWFGQAAGAGIAEGEKELVGIMKNHADRVEAECLAKQAAAGVANAQLYYGKLLEEGRGVPKNLPEAARWILLAAQAGDVQAQIHLALSHLAGTMGRPDVEQAAHWLEQAALQGDPLAQWHLGGLFAKGGVGLQQDLKQAFHWCRLAAKAGFVPAQATLGYLYNRIGDGEAARQWLESAAKAGDAEAQFNLALLMTSEGNGSDFAFEVAAEWLLAAAEQGLAVAQTELGLRYVKGQGVLMDPVEGHKWFILAAQRREQAASSNLQLSEAKLNLLQVSEAKRRAKNWVPKPNP